MEQLLSFLGPASYYRKFLKDFGTKASQLYQITAGKQKYQWNLEAVIVLSMEHFQRLFYGKEFVLVADHQSLKLLMSQKNPAPKLARYITKPGSYEFRMEYRKGKQNGNAHAVSRWSIAPDED